MLQEVHEIDEVDVEIGNFRKMFWRQCNCSKFTDFIIASLVKQNATAKGLS